MVDVTSDSDLSIDTNDIAQALAELFDIMDLNDISIIFVIFFVNFHGQSSSLTTF
jgi:hypothetical protein